MTHIFNTVLYQPLYNVLISLISIVPGESLGLAIIILTILVKTILLPLAHRQSRSQAKMKQIEPEMQVIREKHKDDKQEQARKTMELYQKHGINPFSGCLLMFIQIPVIIALYWVFFKGLKNGVDTNLLYSFVQNPEHVNALFLGFFDLFAAKTLGGGILAVLSGATQFYQMKLAMPGAPVNSSKKDGELSFKEEFAKNMNTQFKYVMPGLIVVFAFSLPAAVGLYWTTSNIFSIVHELIVQREAKKITT